jgi:leucyl aminopeptidase
MLPCFVTEATAARPIWAVPASGYEAWCAARPENARRWLEGIGFVAKPGLSALLPAADGTPAGAVLVLSEPPEPWDFAGLPSSLPAGDWRLENGAELDPTVFALGWALAAYRFDRYRKSEAQTARLVVVEDGRLARAGAIAEAVQLARDLINTAAADLGPAELAESVSQVAGRFGAALEIIEGEALSAGYPAIYAVGKGSERAPRLIDLRFGDPERPKLTLVGKGVCFDTGGLDLKPAANMRLMKKDMGGAAVTLGLAQAVMALGLPVRLRLLIGAVENSVSAASFRPGDVLATRKGLTVEVGNTDAEGRLVLADLLTEADGERPDLILDCATLTGAARVALGPDLPALFTPDDDLATDLLAGGQAAFEPLWRLPLHAGYRPLLESPIADLDNAPSGGYAGAITAALFLERFVTETKAWAHLDIFGWNLADRPGRPKGGEATALRALLAGIERFFSH